jgi:hypothetical protein
MEFEGLDILEKDGLIQVFMDGARMYELRTDSSLILPVSNRSLSEIKARIHETKYGLNIIIAHPTRPSLRFPYVKNIEKFEGRVFANLERITDNGKPTLWDWLRNKKNYEYTIWLK